MHRSTTRTARARTLAGTLTLILPPAYVSPPAATVMRTRTRILMRRVKPRIYPRPVAPKHVRPRIANTAIEGMTVSASANAGAHFTETSDGQVSPKLHMWPLWAERQPESTPPVTRRVHRLPIHLAIIDIRPSQKLLRRVRQYLPINTRLLRTRCPLLRATPVTTDRTSTLIRINPQIATGTPIPQCTNNTSTTKRPSSA
ncbi:unnamed protein product [Peniophora sp. CBMAI 1063]|nr:unnamed protein product [Peniophora sp. CBMAI 1063]